MLEWRKNAVHMELLFHFFIITLTKNQAMLKSVKLCYFMPIFIISFFLSKLKHKNRYYDILIILGFSKN